MKKKVEKWYFSLCYLGKICLFIFLFSLIFTLLAYLGMQSDYISQINKSNIEGNLMRGFLYLLKFLFVTEHNRLNWVGISALGVMVSYIVNSKFNRAKLRADIVSSERIRWLGQTRSLASDILSESNNTISHVNTYFHYKFKLLKEEIKKEDIEYTTALIKEKLNEYNNGSKELDKILLMFMMQFGMDKENNKLISIAEDIREINQQYNLYQNQLITQEKEIEEIKNLVKSASVKYNEKVKIFTKECRKYFKVEWDRAKAGE